MSDSGTTSMRGVSPMESSRAIDEASAAALTGVRELSYPEIRHRLVIELRMRGIMPPPPLVDRLAMDILLGTSFGGRMRRAVSRTTAAIQLVNFGAKATWALMHRQQLPAWNLGGIRQISPDVGKQAQVIIDQAGHEALAVGGDDIIEVWFGKPVAEEEPEKSIVVFRGEERIGILNPEADNIYRSATQRAYDSGLVPVTYAIRVRKPDDSWALYIGGHPAFLGQDRQ